MMKALLNTGLVEFVVKSEKERIRRYRRYVYEAGSLNQPERGNAKVIEDKILRKERGRSFELSKRDRLRYRTGGGFGDAQFWGRP